MSHRTSTWLRRLASPTAAVTGSAILAALLLGVAWADSVTARRDLLALARDHAASLRAVLAAAARANQAAAAQAREELTARLLDNARLLVALDARQPLTDQQLSAIVDQHRLFRVTVLGPHAEREHFVMARREGQPATGPETDAWMAAPGAGIGPGATQLIDRLITRGEPQAVTDLHAGRRGGVARLAVGARRQGGGAVLISVDASDVAQLERQAPLDALLDDVIASTPDVAYVVLDHGDTRSVRGATLPADLLQEPAAAGDDLREHRHDLDGRAILELSGPVPFTDNAPAHLRIGMRLDGLDQIARQALVRTALSLGAAIVVGALALGLVWLQRDYGSLAEAHARAREALVRRDRLAAMGELSSTVAHEIRNPLNAIAMSAQRLRSEYRETLGADEDATALLDVIRAESQRLDLKIRQFLDFARPPRLLVRGVEIGAWLSQAVQAQRALADARTVSLTVSLPAPCDVAMDPDQMQQVIDNLVRNAIEAAPAGGQVTVDGVVDAKDVRISVEDDGPGIPDEVRHRIFDLYFTTKRDGTGIGLAVAHQVATAHGGRIEVAARRDGQRGTCMTVRWPRSSQAA